MPPASDLRLLPFPRLYARMREGLAAAYAAAGRPDDAARERARAAALR